MANKLMLSALLLVTCAASAATPESRAKEPWYRLLRGELLCAWKESERHPANSPELPFCADRNYGPAVLVDDDVNAWFDHWKAVDPARGTAAQKRFNAEVEAAAIKLETEMAQQRDAEAAAQRATEQERRRRLAEEERWRYRERRAADQKREKTLADRAISLSDMELCWHFRAYDSDAAKAELKRRDSFSPEDWLLIEDRNIRIGMKEAGVVCALGNDHRVNRTVRANRVSKQYVYPNVYVYVENGVVTAFQD